MGKRISAAILKAYKAFLWIAGFHTGDYITFMWRRQEKRLGVLWWILVASTESLAVALLDSWHSMFRISVQFVTCIAIAVVFWHVATGNLPPGEN